MQDTQAQKPEGGTEQQPTEVKQEDAPPAVVVAEEKSEHTTTEEKKNEEPPPKSPKQNEKRQNSKPRSRSNSLNRGATTKEWKPKGAEGTKPLHSTINVDAPPFVSQLHHHREVQQQQQSVPQEADGSVAEEGEHSHAPGHHLQTPWTFWFSRKSKKGKGQANADGESTEGNHDEQGEEKEKEKEKEKDKEKGGKGKKKKEQKNDTPHRGLLTQLGTVNTVEEFWTYVSIFIIITL